MSTLRLKYKDENSSRYVQLSSEKSSFVHATPSVDDDDDDEFEGLPAEEDELSDDDDDDEDEEGKLTALTIDPVPVLIMKRICR